jgi:hypothetical protein
MFVRSQVLGIYFRKGAMQDARHSGSKKEDAVNSIFPQAWRSGVERLNASIGV